MRVRLFFLNYGEFDMRHVSNCIAAALLVFAGGSQLRADSVYQLTGNFGAEIEGTSELADGSFSLTYSIAGLPLGSGDSAPIDSASGTLYDSMGHVVDSFTTGSGSFVDSSNVVDATLGLGDGFGHFTFQFAEGFDGVGALIPTPSPPVHRINTQLVTGTGDVSITSGYSSAVVPEPSSLILAGIAAMMMFGFFVRRRRPAIAVA